MLKHMGQTGIIDGAGEKRQVESAVDIIICDIKQSGASPFVYKKNQFRTDHWEFSFFFYGKAADDVSHIRKGLLGLG